jgi:hypothetical protein
MRSLGSLLIVYSLSSLSGSFHLTMNSNFLFIRHLRHHSFGHEIPVGPCPRFISNRCFLPKQSGPFDLTTKYCSANRCKELTALSLKCNEATEKTLKRGSSRNNRGDQNSDASTYVSNLRLKVNENNSSGLSISRFNRALKLCAQERGQLHLAEEIIALMQKANVQTNERSFNILLRCIADSSDERGEVAFQQGLSVLQVNFTALRKSSFVSGCTSPEGPSRARCHHEHVHVNDSDQYGGGRLCGYPSH